MKLFRVNYFTYSYLQSFLRPVSRDPEEFEVVQTAGYPESFLMLREMGFNDGQAGLMLHTLFLQYRQVMGTKAQGGWSNLQIWSGVQSSITPLYDRWLFAQQRIQIPSVVIYYTLVVVGVALAYYLFKPSSGRLWKVPPIGVLYLGTYDEQLWWMHLVSVNPDGVGFYKAFTYTGDSILAHFPNQPSLRGNYDQLYFSGSIRFNCWRWFRYRLYTLLEANCTYIGLLTRAWGHVYKLRQGYFDPGVPSGPYIVPEDSLCTWTSPCDAPG